MNITLDTTGQLEHKAKYIHIHIWTIAQMFSMCLSGSCDLDIPKCKVRDCSAIFVIPSLPPLPLIVVCCVQIQSLTKKTAHNHGYTCN